MLVWYALLTIFTIMLVTYIGLTISVKIENSVAYILFWVIYLILLATIINGISIANFWGVLQNKTGPPPVQEDYLETKEIGVLKVNVVINVVEKKQFKQLGLRLLKH